MEFLHCCCLLLAHHDTSMQLTDNISGQLLIPHAHMFPRQLMLHFWRDMLGPLFQNRKGCQPSIYNYADALLSHAGIPADSTYTQGFFTAEHLKTIYLV